MRVTGIAIAAILIAMILPSCKGREPVSIIFTGDDEGTIFAAG